MDELFISQALTQIKKAEANTAIKFSRLYFNACRYYFSFYLVIQV